MKIIKREYQAVNLKLDNGGYKPRWVFTLECGHKKTAHGYSSRLFRIADVAARTNCEICEKPKKQKSLKDLDNYAKFISNKGW